MATQGPLGPGTGADAVGIGLVAWTNPGNVTAEDGVFATSAITSAGGTHWLKATNFGFSIPGGATINGITVEWKRKASVLFEITDAASRIVQGGTIGSTDEAAGGNWGTTLAYQTYGSGSDLWGLSWTAADINSSGFGAALAAQNSVPGAATCSVDYCRITVAYDAPDTPGLIVVTRESIPFIDDSFP